MSSSSTPPAPSIKTRFLILSDTHGLLPQAASTSSLNSVSTDDELSTKIGLHRASTGYREPLAQVDVALHCGDLTKRSGVDEYRRTFAMLRAIRAPLKLVICGNHDSAMDPDFYINNIGGEQSEVDEIQQIIKDAEADGVRYLTEGTYTFTLTNGAKLRIYASQYTPQFGYWVYQYYSGEHTFSIPEDIDIVMTHGPPLGVLDTTRTHNNAGCASLFRAITSSRPKIHCFGHIHESWGAYLAKWQTERASSFIPFKNNSVTSIDAANSRTIESLDNIKPSIGNEEREESERKHKRLLELSKKRGFHVDLTEGENQLTSGEQTLFVNAAIMDIRYYPTQLPWLIDVSLAKAE